MDLQYARCTMYEVVTKYVYSADIFGHRMKQIEVGWACCTQWGDTCMQGLIKSEGKRQLQRPSHIWEGCIKNVYLINTGCSI